MGTLSTQRDSFSRRLFSCFDFVGAVLIVVYALTELSKMSDSSSVVNVPAAPAVLNIPGTLTVIEWADSGGVTRYLQDKPDSHYQISFHLYFDTSSNTAFFKLCIPYTSG